MTTLNIYIATVIFSIISTTLLALKTRIYQKKHNLTLATERATGSFPLYVICLIPLINVWLGFSLMVGVLSTKTFEKNIKLLVESGKVVTKE